MRDADAEARERAAGELFKELSEQTTLATAMSGWLAALIVAAVYAAGAGVLALAGRKQVGQASPPVPEQAVETTKEDVKWVKHRAKSARSS